MTGNRACAGPRRAGLLAALALAVLSAAPAAAALVDVDVVSDVRGALPLYRAGSRGHATHRSWLEARRGERYGIRIRNNTGSRIAVVVAVDGRNIVSGARSDLRRDERMYVVAPYESATYDGWRTAQDTVNRFYFTEPGDSYAEAFGDRSAMGVIAVAVYREAGLPPIARSQRLPPPAAPQAEKRAEAPAPGAAARGQSPTVNGDSAGTGFGEEADSPSIRVAFTPEARAAERHFLKYEWRETLCQKGIVDCRSTRNRFWDDAGYAPYPPGRHRGGD